MFIQLPGGSLQLMIDQNAEESASIIILLITPKLKNSHSGKKLFYECCIEYKNVL